ncbi:MAG: J domain-containing protein [Deltaproteobacteria bacterium]|nr:J domain-containing protein [Deltaproteobacteria bacterium]
MSEPTLPDTQDPFALLGVARDADERALRKAYAGLIKIFRPDRAPDEFARVHAAFERARALRASRDAPVVPPAKTEATEASAAAPVGPDHEAIRAHLAAIEAALATTPARDADAPPAANPALDRALGDALDARVPLDELFGKLAADSITARLASPALTWARLATYRTDPGRAIVLLRAVQDRLGFGRADDAAALLDHPTLVDDAADDLAVAVFALRGLVALGWQSDRAAAIEARFHALPRHPVIDRILDELPLELGAATALRAPGVPALPIALAKYLRFRHLVPSDDDHVPALALIARELRDHPQTCLDAFDALYREAPAAAAALERLLRGYTPPAAEHLARLPDPVRAELDARFGTEAMPWWYPTRVAPEKLALGGGIALIGALSTENALAIAGFAVVATAAITAYVRARPRYDARARARIARVLAAVAVPNAIAAAWLRAHPRRVARLAPFVGDMQLDRGLEMFGLVAGMTRASRPCWQAARRPAGAEADARDEADDDAGDPVPG